MRSAWLVLLAACGGEGKGGFFMDAPAMIDGSSDAPMAPCADDSALEPNETIASAFATSVDQSAQMLTLTGLALCPATDKDHYKITVSTANKSLEVIASWDTGTPVSLSVLAASGTSIVNGSPMGSNALRACASNLPVGTYYASVFAAQQQGSYRLAIRIAASCI